MKKNNIAIIGLGYWGTIVTNALISLSIFKNIFIYDSDKNKVKIIKKKFGNKVISTDLSKIKKDIKIKNIFLATPPKNNFNIIRGILIIMKCNETRFSYIVTISRTKLVGIIIFFSAINQF